MSGLTTPASAGDLEWIERTLKGTHIVDDRDDLDRMWREYPWGIRRTDRSEVAVLGPWREHLRLCAIFGLFCPPRRIGALVADLEDVAREQGFARLLGPLVPETAARPYFEAGLQPCARIVVMHLQRLDPRALGAVEAPEGVALREATGPGDLALAAAVDAASFDDFWRQDASGIERYARIGRIVLAEREGQPIGYTLATVRGDGGSLGRLAVVPEERGRGIGRALTRESLAWMVARGVRSAALSTQESNAVSRGLYRSLGFRESPVALLATISRPLVAGEE